MAKDWAKKFYDSKVWKDTRDSIMAEYFGICQRCKEQAAEIVHHIIWLNPNNINNPEITLGRDNLIPVCRECHAIIHERKSATVEGLMFDKEGNIVCS